MILEKLVSYLNHCAFTSENLSLVLQQFSDEQKLPYGKLMALVRHSITGGMVRLKQIISLHQCCFS